MKTPREWRPVEKASSVDLLVLKAYWEGSKLAVILTLMYWRTSLYSLWLDTPVLLGIGQMKMVAILKCEMFKMSIITSTSWLANLFSTWQVILSGPAALFIFRYIKCVQLIWQRDLEHDVTCLISHQISLELLLLRSLQCLLLQSCSGTIVSFFFTWPKMQPFLLALDRALTSPFIQGFWLGEWLFCVCDPQIVNTFAGIRQYWRSTPISHNIKITHRWCEKQ